MIELVLLTAMNRLANWGLAPILVTRTVADDVDALCVLLSDPRSQHRLLRTRGRARLTVKRSRSGSLITTEVRSAGRTVAWLTWILTGARGTTDVTVALQPDSRRLVTRLALVLGGRRWIARRLEATLATLALTAAHVVEHAVDGHGSRARSAVDAAPPPESPIATVEATAEHR